MKKYLYLSTFSVVYTVVFQLFYNWIRHYTPWPYEDFTNFLTSTFANLIPFWVLSTLIWIIVCYVPTPAKNWLKISIDLLLTGIALTLVNLTIELVTPYHVEWGGTAFNATFIFLGITTYYYVTKYTQSMEMEAMAREQMLHYRYDSLKAHVNPHFLFNSLNILSSLIVIDPDASRKFIISLSRLYRYIMSKEGCDEVSVEEELSFLKNYIEVLEIRYGGNLTVNLKVDEGVGQRHIIPYTMQLLMENVIKHNVISVSFPMTVDIEIGNEGINFRNKIKKKQSESISHIGTRYLTNLYSLKGRTFITKENDDNFEVKVEYLN